AWLDKWHLSLVSTGHGNPVLAWSDALRVTDNRILTVANEYNVDLWTSLITQSDVNLGSRTCALPRALLAAEKKHPTGGTSRSYGLTEQHFSHGSTTTFVNHSTSCPLCTAEIPAHILKQLDS